jgi:galactokinase
MLTEHTKPFHARGRAINLYADEFESGPTRLVRSPGRIAIIGDHVDHEGGLVLPMAIDIRRSRHTIERAMGTGGLKFTEPRIVG